MSADGGITNSDTWELHIPLDCKYTYPYAKRCEKSQMAY